MLELMTKNGDFLLVMFSEEKKGRVGEGRKETKYVGTLSKDISLS